MIQVLDLVGRDPLVQLAHLNGIHKGRSYRQAYLECVIAEHAKNGRHSLALKEMLEMRMARAEAMGAYAQLQVLMGGGGGVEMGSAS